MTPANDVQRSQRPHPEAFAAAAFKQKRESLGWSQTQVATMLGQHQGLEIDGTAITRIERGERRIRLDEAVALSICLGLDLYEMIAPHPGDLDAQLERAHSTHQHAKYARDWWAQEESAAGARLDELERLKGEHEALSPIDQLRLGVPFPTHEKGDDGEHQEEA